MVNQTWYTTNRWLTYNILKELFYVYLFMDVHFRIYFFYISIFYLLFYIVLYNIYFNRLSYIFSNPFFCGVTNLKEPLRF